MSNIKGSIIIPTKDKITRLQLILEALSYQVNEEIEVIIVFDGCRSETIDHFYKLCLSYLPKKVVSSDNIGRAAARNLGLSAACGEIVIFLDDDRIPAPDFVTKHLAGHQQRCVLIGERKQIDLSEGEIELFAFDFGPDLFQEFSKRMYVEFFNSITKRLLLSPRSYFRWLGLATGNVSIPREALIKVGGFDENFVGWGYEDIELGYRLFIEGIPFIKDSSIINYHITHEHSHDKYSQEFRNLTYFIKKIRRDFFPKVILRLLLLRLNIRVFFKTYT